MILFKDKVLSTLSKLKFCDMRLMTYSKNSVLKSIRPVEHKTQFKLLNYLTKESEILENIDYLNIKLNCENIKCLTN